MAGVLNVNICWIGLSAIRFGVALEIGLAGRDLRKLHSLRVLRID